MNPDVIDLTEEDVKRGFQIACYTTAQRRRRLFIAVALSALLALFASLSTSNEAHMKIGSFDYSKMFQYSLKVFSFVFVGGFAFYLTSNLQKSRQKRYSALMAREWKSVTGGVAKVSLHDGFFNLLFSESEEKFFTTQIKLIIETQDYFVIVIGNDQKERFIPLPRNNLVSSWLDVSADGIKKENVSIKLT